MNIQTINGCHNYGQPINGRKERQERRAERREDVKEFFDKGKEVVTKVVDKGKDIAAGAAFLPAREGVKQLIKFNILGVATILAYYKRSKPDRYGEILNVWDKYGGDKATLNVFVNEGSGKSIRQVAPAVLNKFAKIRNMVKLAYKINSGAINGCKRFPSPQTIGDVPPPDPATTIALIGSAIGIITEIINIFKKDKATDPDAIPDSGSPQESPQGGSQTDPSEVGKPEDKATKDNTMLYVGIAAAAVVGYFAFFKK
jgi:hypothetical protein